ncbi:LamG-like jellyroll fold domain-containing protein [Lacipirellula parvula]|uniref:Ice-binding protein C-terminal domain-containing protein n=1 Tax=Lacipirellula parvula TaxID=2650471 RepID=A0A5K7X5U0_9BACT|nr:LamG-like jellyroll fold domain-containing protein [Lacipirellula parvula]BBO31182.1 hypothetical protein PLANPX_0794 [Lacipirellula parvula]
MKLSRIAGARRGGVCRWVRHAAVLAGTLSASGASAATIAHWTFETDMIAGSATTGQTVSHPSANGLHDNAIPDLSGNGNHLSAFAQNGSFTAMLFSNVVAPNAQSGTTLSIENAPTACCGVLSTQDDLEVGGVNIGALPQWSIEASVNFKGVNGYQTIVGKDGFGEATNGDTRQAILYLQKTNTNVFRINFVDVQGYVHIADGTTQAAIGQWYHLSATSDGNSLKLFVNGVLEKSFDMTTTLSTDRSMAALNEAGFEGTGTVAPYGWTTHRGMYNDGHGDRVNGYIDDVRISNAALAPAQMLFVAIPEPATLALAGFAAMGIVASRRRA